MRRGPAFPAVVVFAVLLAHGLSLRAQAPSNPARHPLRHVPQFSSGIELVPLEVCVKDRNGQPTQGLGPSDFLVLENDILQRITFFFPEHRARLAVTLLVDASQSMKGERLERAKAAAAGFIDILRDDDLVEVISFNERAELRYALGPDRRQAAAAIDDIRAGGRTGLHEAVLAALGRFERTTHTDHADDRQVLVVLSDGEDTSSLPTFDDVLDMARRSHVLVYTVSLPNAGRAKNGSGWQMTRLAHDTGGRTVAVKTLSELVPLYQEIAAELIHLYRIGFVPAPAGRAEGWRSIKVRVPGKDVVVRTRTGYYASRTRRSTVGDASGSQRPKNPGMQVASHSVGSGAHGNGR
jgi:VWFA-related protein